MRGNGNCLRTNQFLIGAWCDGVEFTVGDHVRVRPRSGGDIMDVALAGNIAIIEGMEQDYEGKV